MARLEHLPWLLSVHIACSLSAVVLGGVMLARRKGTSSHRRLGWAWVALMAGSALTSVFIGEGRLLGVPGLTPIHGFTVLVAVMLPLGVAHARAGRVQRHRRTLVGLYLGACAAAGLFTLLPGRLLGGLLWRDLLGLGA
jgi:uncharacterized membrane protein